MTAAISVNGRIKCSEKNRFKVAIPIENPPQSHLTTSSPTIGIADKRFVITVAPQKDICPHGSTYPKKAVAINKIIIVTPESQVLVNLNDD